MASSTRTNPLRALQSPRVRLFLLSVVLGLVATMLVRNWVDQQIAAVSGGKLVPVVFAQRSIQSGGSISTADLAVRQIPEAYVHLRAIETSYRDFLPGQTARVDIRAGQPILWTELALESEASLSERLRVNERAITIRVDSGNSFAGMIRPGDRVDILSVARPTLKDDPELRLLFQNVLILAVDDRMRDDSVLVAGGGDAAKTSNTASSLTLRLSAEGAARLAQAEAKGPLTLLLRNPNDIFPTTITEESAAGAPAGALAVSKDVVGYPTIYERGGGTRSAYYPPPVVLGDDMRDLSPEEFRRRVLTSLTGEVGAGNPR